MSLAIRAALFLLTRMKDPALLPVALQLVERLLPSGEDGLRTLLSLARHRSWAARYVAAKNLGTFSHVAPGQVWDALIQLGHDSERFVREGVPISLATIVERGSEPGIAQRLKDLARSNDAHFRRLCAYTAVVLWRKGVARDLGTDLLEMVGRETEDGIGRLLGKRILGEELVKHNPAAVLDVVERWAASPDEGLRWQAAQALQGTLSYLFPEQAERVRKLLQEAGIKVAQADSQTARGMEKEI